MTLFWVATATTRSVLEILPAMRASKISMEEVARTPFRWVMTTATVLLLRISAKPIWTILTQSSGRIPKTRLLVMPRSPTMTVVATAIPSLVVQVTTISPAVMGLTQWYLAEIVQTIWQARMMMAVILSKIFGKAALMVLIRLIQ